MYPNIDAERSRHGLTKNALSQKLGVSRKTYYNWEKRGRIPKNKLVELADLFNVSVDYLLAN